MSEMVAVGSFTAQPREVRPLDFLAVDELLTDEERDIRDTVRAFVRDRVVPYVGDWFEEARLPRELAGSWASSACSACIWRATGALVRAPRRTA